MVLRLEYECSSCRKGYFLRIAIGKAFSHKFRYNCPYCRHEVHGEIIVEYRNTDGSLIDPKEWNQIIKITGSKKLKENTIKGKSVPALTIFSDLPILEDNHISSLNTKIAMPMFQILRMMGEQKAKGYIKLLEIFYSIPEDDFWTIRNCEKSYRNGEINRSRKLLKNIVDDIPKKNTRIPSVCGLLYNSYFSRLLGYSNEMIEHIKIVDELIKKHPIKVFEIPKEIFELNIIEHMIEIAFDFTEEIYNSKVLLAIGRYLEFINHTNKPKHRLTHDYPELFFHIYEQACELSHYYIKIHIGYINLLKRNNLNSFKDNKFRSYKKYFKNAKLFDSLELVTENSILSLLYSENIVRDIRNGISHRAISFSNDGQNIIVRKRNRELTFNYDDVLLKTVKLCRICINGFSVITDIYRLISDKAWEVK